MMSDDSSILQGLLDRAAIFFTVPWLKRPARLLGKVEETSSGPRPQQGHVTLVPAKDRPKDAVA
jgi:hypothetical protein